MLLVESACKLYAGSISWFTDAKRTAWLTSPLSATFSVPAWAAITGRLEFGEGARSTDPVKAYYYLVEAVKNARRLKE